MGEDPARKSAGVPTPRTLPTLTKAAADYFLARPEFAQSVMPLAGLGHPSAGGLLRGHRVGQGVDIDRLAGGIGDPGLANHRGQRLAAANVGVQNAQFT
jgi:hypothetical protein